MRFVHRLVPVVLLALVVAFSPAAFADFVPSRVECIAPANPGGGWDFTCRSVGDLLARLDLVPGSVRTTNMPGTSGAIAFAHVVTSRRADPNLLVAASPATTSAIAQGLYGQFTENDARWVAALGADFGTITVRSDAPWKTLGDLVEEWRADPSAIAFGGGSAVGGQDHLKVLVLAKAAGIDVRKVKYVPFEGGGEAITSLLGGFVDVFPGDVSEMLGQFEAGRVRVLAVLAPERLEGSLSDIPTANEQGLNAEWVIWRGFYAPPGIPDDAYAYWVEALKKVAESDEWAERRQQNGLARFWMGGEAFDAFVKQDVHNLRQLIEELELRT